MGPPAAQRVRRRAAAASRERGVRALLDARRDPGALPELAAGRWWDVGWRRRSVRRAALAVPGLARLLPGRTRAEVAFWAGVRAAATAAEWHRLTRSSYVVLCYHRTAGLALPGQERMDVAPSAVDRQLGLLRRCGWRPLAPAELVRFHTDPTATLPRRRFVVTADDGYVDAVAAMTRHAGARPQVFVVTGSVGGRGEWLGGARLADWPALERLQRAGAVVGSHARRHLPLDTLPADEVADELAGSLRDLRGRLDVPLPVLAYPHGRHDERVRAAARAAGYGVAYGTAQGRNGAGTDRWTLRRIEPKAWDTTASFAWKVLVGQSPPRGWERRLVRRWERRRATAAQPGGASST
ncbi:polysaccharide deacetylase family protein [Blastococcus sp. SYSU D00695]